MYTLLIYGLSVLTLGALVHAAPSRGPSAAIAMGLECEVGRVEPWGRQGHVRRIHHLEICVLAVLALVCASLGGGLDWERSARGASIQGINVGPDPAEGIQLDMLVTEIEATFG